MKYILYVRKSTDSEDRQIQSIEDQLRELEIISNRRKLKIIKTFKESQSAKLPGRSQYNEMMSMIKSGEADGILCWKLNRLARNPVDGGEIQWLLQQNIIKSIVTPSREYLPTDNVIMMAVELGMATQFVLDLSKDVKRGMQAKVSKGWRPQKAPLGYLNDKYGDKGNKKIFKDPERFDLLRKMWELLLTGRYSVPRIQEIATERWGFRSKTGKQISLGRLYHTFTNSFYYGEFSYNGEIHQGKHDAMITPEEFDKAQTILKRKGKPRPKNKRLPFTGIIQCAECGGMITAEEKVKRNKSTGEMRSYIYHRCTKRKVGIKCNQQPIKYEELAEQIKVILGSISIPEEFLRWALGVLKDQNQLEENNRGLMMTNLHKAHERCVKSIGNLIKLYTSPDNADMALLSTEEYKEQKEYLMRDKNRLETEIRKHEDGVNDWVELTEKTFHFARYAQHWFENGDFEKKTEILGCLGQNFTLNDKELSLELAKPYIAIKKGKEMEAIVKSRLELSPDASVSQIDEIRSIWSG